VTELVDARHVVPVYGPVELLSRPVVHIAVARRVVNSEGDAEGYPPVRMIREI